jgi:hypothetical protein
VIEIGDVVRKLHYSIDDAGKQWVVTDIQYAPGGNLILAERRGVSGIEVRKFHSGDIVVVRKAQFAKGGHVNHDCFVRPFGFGEQFFSKPPSPSAKTFLALDGTAYSLATVENGPDGLPKHIIIHTNEVQEDTAVSSLTNNRLQYTEPAREELSAKLEELGKQRAELAAKATKHQNKVNAVSTKLYYLDRTIKQHEDLREKAALRLPVEPSRHGHLQVVTFEKTFGKRYGTGYQYAAIRPAGKTAWSVTGKTELNGITWDELVDFILSDEVTFTHRQRALASLRVRG